MVEIFSLFFFFLLFLKTRRYPALGSFLQKKKKTKTVDGFDGHDVLSVTPAREPSAVEDFKDDPESV